MAKAYAKNRMGRRRKPRPYAVRFTVVRRSAKGNCYTALAAFTRFKTRNGIFNKKLASLCFFEGQKVLPVLSAEEQILVDRARGIIKRCTCTREVDLLGHDGLIHDFGIYKVAVVTDRLCGGQAVERNGYYFVLPEDETRAYFNQEYSPFEDGGRDG